MSSYEHLIPQNTAPPGARVIDVCDAGGSVVGQIPLGGLKSKVKGKKLYSCMMLADTHVERDDEANALFAAAMQYLGSSQIDFACIAGDLVHDGTVEEQWITYEAAITDHAKGKTICAATGNHESYWKCGGFVTKYTGHGHYFLKEIGDDVFLFLNCYGYKLHEGSYEYQYYTAETRATLYRIFEKYRNKRCFVFQHVPTTSWLVDEDADGRAWLPCSMWKHYKNCIQFYGHRHYGAEYQEINTSVNYNVGLGFKQIHVPTLVDTGQFFVVDVYKEGLNIRTIDINTEQPVLIGCFWIDTPLVEIEAGVWSV